MMKNIWIVLYLLVGFVSIYVGSWDTGLACFIIVNIHVVGKEIKADINKKK